VYARAVRAKPRLVGVRLAAQLADVRSLAGVRARVDQTRAAEAERASARVARERTLVGVEPRVLHELHALRVRLAARAHERPLAGVHAQVRPQVAGRREVLVAHVARVRAAPRAAAGRAPRRPVVHVPEVEPQLAAGVEALRAEAARVRARRHVHGEVVLEVGAPDERASAQLAHVRLVSAVQRQVPAQVAGEREPAAARVALVRPLAGVRPLVQHQSLLLREAASARLAHVQPCRRRAQHTLAAAAGRGSLAGDGGHDRHAGGRRQTGLGRRWRQHVAVRQRLRLRAAVSGRRRRFPHLLSATPPPRSDRLLLGSTFRLADWWFRAATAASCDWTVLRGPFLFIRLWRRVITVQRLASIIVLLYNYVHINQIGREEPTPFPMAYVTPKHFSAVNSNNRAAFSYVPNYTQPCQL